MAEEHKPLEQADGFTPDPDVDEGDVMVAEVVDTATIDGIMDEFINATSEVFEELIEVSHNGNPVATHMALLSVVSAVEEALYQLKDELIESLAKHGDEFQEKGGTLRTQVIDEED